MMGFLGMSSAYSKGDSNIQISLEKKKDFSKLDLAVLPDKYAGTFLAVSVSSDS